jgi:hypothetical protein
MTGKFINNKGGSSLNGGCIPKVTVTYADDLDLQESIGPNRYISIFFDILIFDI